MIKRCRLLCSLLVLCVSGCTALGVAAYKLKPPETIHPVYTALGGQSIGVMVWADRGIRIDWPTAQLDMANAIESKLMEEAKHATKKNNLLLGTTFPIQPASIVRYQKDHPEIEAQPILEVAPHLGVTRLIYVELQDFATRSDMSVDLYRGIAVADVRLIEIENGQARVAFEKTDVHASYPPKAPQEGMPGVGDVKTYGGTVDAFGTEVVHLFVPYQVEE